MSENKEQTTAALNTLINLALQVAGQQQVQNAANVLAQALELGPADAASEEAEVEEPKIVTTD
jgi:UDP-N-acetylmuramyl pentapeptide synthase